MIPAGFGASLAGPGTAEVQYLGTNSALAQGLQAPIDAAVARIAAVATAARAAVAEGAGSWDQATPPPRPATRTRRA